MKRSLTILILSFLILFGSLVQRPESMASIESYTTTAEEIEPFVLEIGTGFLTTSLWLKELSLFVDNSHKDSDFISTVPQLLCSHRIALPPPLA